VLHEPKRAAETGGLQALVIFGRFCRTKQDPTLPTYVRNAEQFAIGGAQVGHGVLGKNAVPPASQMLGINPDCDELLANYALR
jgi:hypothetical protein